MKTAFQKTMSLVLAFIMVFSMLTITASAELTYDGEATLSAVVADGTYELNDTFDVTVVLTGGKFHGIEYALTYDSTALQLYQVYNADEEAFVEANETNVVTAMEVDMAGMPECTLSAGVVSVAWAKSGSAKTFNDAAILTLKFKVIAETGATASFDFSKFLASVCVDELGAPTTVAAGNPATYATMNKVAASVTIAAAPATPTPTEAPVDTGLMQVTDETLDGVAAKAPWDIEGPGFTAWSWEITGDVSQVFSKTTDSAYVTAGTSAILANLEKAGAQTHSAGGCYIDYTANNLEEGKTYKLTFKAKAADVADLSKVVFDVNTEINSIANTISVVSKSGTLSNEWSEFEIVFTAHPATSGVGPNTGYEFAGHTCIRITVAATEAITGFLAIDDMAIVEVAVPTATPTPEPTATPVPTATPTPVPEGISLTASASSATVEVGTQNTVSVVMSGNTGVAAMQFELTYDSAVLSVDSVTPGLGGKGTMDINTSVAGKISIAWVNAIDINASALENYTGNDAVLTVVFNTIAEGSSALAITDKGAYSADEIKVNVTPVVVDFTVTAAAAPTEAPTATPTPEPTATPTPAPSLVNLLKISEETATSIVDGAWPGAVSSANGGFNNNFGSWASGATMSIDTTAPLYGDKTIKIASTGGNPHAIVYQNWADLTVERGKTYTFFAKVRGEGFDGEKLGGFTALSVYYCDEFYNANIGAVVDIETGHTGDAPAWRGATLDGDKFGWTTVKMTFTVPTDDADLTANDGDEVCVAEAIKFCLCGSSAADTTVYFDCLGLVEGSYDHATLNSTVIPALFGEPNAQPTPEPTATPTPVPTTTPIPTATPTPVVGAVEGIVISAASAELDLGESMYLSAAVLPADALNKSINWYTESNGAVSVVVSDYGIIVTGEKAGTAIITAVSVDGGFTASCVVTVTNKQYKDGLVTEGTISVTPNGGEIVVGQSIKLEATISPAMKGAPLFYSNNLDVAYVDVTSGVLTAVAPGTVVITVVWSDTLVRTVAVFTVVETATPVTPAPTLNGEPSDWAKAEILEALALGLVPEHLNGNYTNDITRSQFCDIIINLIEKKTGKAIADVIAGYADAVEAIAFTDTNNANVTAASQLGIVNGRATAGIFDPDANITRQEAAKMLAMAAKVLGADIKAEPVNFADADAIYDWAKEFVYYVNSIEVMNGTSAGENPNFSPIRTYSIEQSILTILRLFKANI